MDYSHEFDYMTFLAEKSLQQAKMERFINEAVLIGNGTNNISNIQIVQESFGESVKKVVNKLLTFIGKLWGKFIEAMNVIIKNDVKYLERYKDIILKKKPVDDVIIYDYFKGGVQLLLNGTIPELNVQELQKDVDADCIYSSKDSFIRAGFAAYTRFGKGPYDEITELATTAFRTGGTEITIPAANINMTDMYNFCYDYGKLKEKIQKDINALNTAKSNVDKTLNDLVSKVPTGGNNGNDNNAANNEPITPGKVLNLGNTKNESALFGSNMYYSEVYERLIHEDEQPGNNAQQGGQQQNQQQQQGSQQQNQQQQQGSQQQQGGQQQNQQQQQGGQQQNQQQQQGSQQQNNQETTDEQLAKSSKAIQDRITVYYEICGQYLAAKFSVAQEMEKKFMIIMKSHVRHYVGTNDKDDDQASKSRSNLNNGNNGTNNPNPSSNYQKSAESNNPLEDGMKQAQQAAKKNQTGDNTQK